MITERFLKNMQKMLEIDAEVSTTPYKVIHEDWLFKLVRFKGKRKTLKYPVLIVYAYINRPYVMDLFDEVSIVKRELNAGLDVWMVDWGYPKQADKFTKIEDYIDYINFCVERIKEVKKVDKVTLHGYCLGGDLAIIYSALYPENVKNLVIQALPIDFHTNNPLAIWARNINPEKITEAIGNASGDLLNFAFLIVDPIRLILGKYQRLLENLDNEKFIENFIRMEKWIFDSPSIPAETFKEYIKEWYHENKLIKNKYVVKGKRVDLKSIKMPVLVLVAEKDHISPPESVKPFLNKISSKDKLLLSVNKGHIGLSTSRAAKEVWDKAIEWIVSRSK